MSHARFSSNLPGRFGHPRRLPGTGSGECAPTTKVATMPVSNEDDVPEPHKPPHPSWVQQFTMRMEAAFASVFVDNPDTDDIEIETLQFLFHTPRGSVLLDCSETECVADLLARVARVAADYGVAAPAKVCIDLPVDSDAISTGTFLVHLPAGTQVTISSDSEQNICYVDDLHLGPAILVATNTENEQAHRDVFSELLVCNLDF